MEKIQIKVLKDDNLDRLDAFLSTKCELSRSQIQKLIKENKILVNGSSTINKYKVSEGDVIDVEYEDKTLTDIKPKNIPLDIVYED